MIRVLTWTKPKRRLKPNYSVGTPWCTTVSPKIPLKTLCKPTAQNGEGGISNPREGFASYSETRSSWRHARKDHPTS